MNQNKSVDTTPTYMSISKQITDDLNALTGHMMARTFADGLCDRLSDNGSKSQIGVFLKAFKRCVGVEKWQCHVAMQGITELLQIGHLHSECFRGAWLLQAEYLPKANGCQTIKLHET